MAMQDLERKVADLEVYLVELEVLSGASLPAKDIDGKSDPFVRIKVGDDKEKTTKVIKNNLNPIWNEKYSFKFLKNPKQITFDVLDEDLTGYDDIGSAVFQLDDLFNSADNKPFEGVLKLNQRKKKKKVLKGSTIKIKVSAQRLLPHSLQKVTEEQKETIFKQNQKTEQQKEMIFKQKEQIERLNDQISSIQKENGALKRLNEELRANEDVKVQEPGSNPPKRSARCNKEVLLGYITVMMMKVLHIIQMVLRTFVYGLPLIGYYADLVVLFIGSLMRLEVGYHVFSGATTSKRPNKTLKLYEYEGNAECKMVREMLCALDLDCIIYPCPESVGPHHYLSRFRDEAKKLCGKSDASDALPLLVDENMKDPDNERSLMLIGAEAIGRYLMEEYGDNVKKSYLERLRYGLVQYRVFLMMYNLVYLGLLRSLPEHGKERKGNTVNPKLMLELFSYEASPFCIKVREVMSSLEIPYLLKNVGHGSMQKRKEFQIRYGKKYPKWRQKLSMIQVPLLIDPNTEREIFESDDIKEYLMKTYIME